MPDVVCVQTPGSPTTGHRTSAVAVLERTAKPTIDQTRRPTSADNLSVTFKPHLTGGITAQVSAICLREQRTQMQLRGALLDVEMHHHGGVLSVRPASHLGVPAGLDQPHERRACTRERWPMIYCAVAVVVIALPLSDQRILMRLQGRVELRRLQMAKFDPPAGALVVGGLGDRGPRFGFRFGPRIGFGVGSRLELDRGAQLTDRRAAGELRIVFIGSVGSTSRNHTDLIQ